METAAPQTAATARNLLARVYIMEEIEAKLDQYHAEKVCIGLNEKRRMYKVLIEDPSTPEHLLKKFCWYNTIPLDFDDNLWTTFTGAT